MKKAFQIHSTHGKRTTTLTTKSTTVDPRTGSNK